MFASARVQCVSEWISGERMIGSAMCYIVDFFVAGRPFSETLRFWHKHSPRTRSFWGGLAPASHAVLVGIQCGDQMLS